jgi:hypothetical protein
MHADGDWLQLDAGSKQAISGVVIQGREAGNQFLKTFMARISDDGSTWNDVECGRAFPASADWHAKNPRYFTKPLLGRYVRVYVDTYNNWPSYRAGLLLCEKECKGKHLDYMLQGDYGSATQGPMIESAWGSGVFTKETGFYFDNGKGLKLDESNCINNKDTYTIIIEARLADTTGSRQVIGSKAWGTDGGVAVAGNAQYQLIPNTAGLECPWKIFDDKYYQFGITRDDKGTVSLYLNGYQCASGSRLSPVENISFTILCVCCPLASLNRVWVECNLWSVRLQANRATRMATRSTRPSSLSCMLMRRHTPRRRGSSAFAHGARLCRATRWPSLLAANLMLIPRTLALRLASTMFAIQVCFLMLRLLRAVISCFAVV